MPSSAPGIQLSYQICPIVLTGGVATAIPGGMLPLINLVSAGGTLTLPNTLNQGQGPPNPRFDPTDLDNAFGAFNVLPGGTLLQMSIGKYPFANQDVAANATIREPLSVSVIMDAPMRGPNPWQVKQTVMSSLKATLDLHNNKGGTYVLATPAFIYDNLILVALTDNSRGNNSLPQNAWRFDFERPLVALRDLQGSLSSIMAKIGLSLPVNSQSFIGPPTEQQALNAGLPPDEGGRPSLVRFRDFTPVQMDSTVGGYLPDTFFTPFTGTIIDLQIIPGFSMPQGVGLTSGETTFRDVAIPLPTPPSGATQTRLNTAGTLIGGAAPRLTGTSSQNIVNYPAIPTPSTYAMNGIS